MGFLDKLFGSLFGRKGRNETPRKTEIRQKPATSLTEDNSDTKKHVRPKEPIQVTEPPPSLAHLESPRKEPIHQFFDLEVPDEIPTDEFEFYQYYLKQVNKEFELMTDFEVELHADKGFDIYNHETDDIVAKVTSAENNFTSRSNSFVSKNHPKFDDLYFRNLGEVSHLFNKYLFNNDFKEKVFTTLFENDEGKKSIRTYFTSGKTKIEERILKHGAHWEVNVKSSMAEEMVRKYEALGVFDNLDETTIKKGKKLSSQYNLVNGQDVLWCFNYLVMACCPRESSGNKKELDAFMEITNNKLTMTNFEEKNVNGKLNVSCEINGKLFKSENLPDFFSLRLIINLNQFLYEHFGSSFFVWEWERNPWEQRTFIYFTKEQLAIRRPHREFQELLIEIVRFYEEH